MLRMGNFVTKDRLGRAISLELTEGAVYFMLEFMDDALSIPVIHTVVYVGQNLDGVDGSLYYFQDINSYQEVGAYPNHKEGVGNVFTLPEKALVNIFVLDGLIKELAQVQVGSS